METKDTIETQETQETQATKTTDNAKDRLDRLKGLYKDGYITEHEFMIARVNILKEEGVDVVTRLQQPQPAFLEQEEEEEEEPKGCGCIGSLAAFLLASLIVMAMCFFAAPHWPEHFGGTEVRAAREWFIATGTNLIDRFSREPDAPAHIPDPVPPVMPPVMPQEEGYPGVTEPEDAYLEQVSDVTSIPRIHILSLASETAEGAIRGYVTVSNARMRSAPDTSTNENVVGWGTIGDRLIILEEGVGTDGSMWYYVINESRNNRRGWISGSLMRLESAE